MGATRIERIRNEYLKGLAQAGQFRDKVREVRLSRHGHVQVRDTGCTGRRMAKMELRGKRETKCRRDERERAGGWSDTEKCKRQQEMETDNLLRFLIIRATMKDLLQEFSDRRRFIEPLSIF